MLYQLVMRVFFHMVAPHYILVGFVTYIFKPRLSHMIHRFREDIILRNKLLNSFKLCKMDIGLGESTRDSFYER